MSGRRLAGQGLLVIKIIELLNESGLKFRVKNAILFGLLRR
jgi:hypothetical protein